MFLKISLFCLNCIIVCFHIALLFLYLGPKPWPPRNVSIEKGPLGVVINWQPPKNQTVPVAFYFVEHRTDDGQWQRWGPIRDETSYLGNFLSFVSFS